MYNLSLYISLSLYIKWIAYKCSRLVDAGTDIQRQRVQGALKNVRERVRRGAGALITFATLSTRVLATRLTGALTINCTCTSRIYRTVLILLFISLDNRLS